MEPRERDADCGGVKASKGVNEEHRIQVVDHGRARQECHQERRLTSKEPIFVACNRPGHELSQDAPSGFKGAHFVSDEARMPLDQVRIRVAPEHEQFPIGLEKFEFRGDSKAQ